MSQSNDSKEEDVFSLVRRAKEGDEGALQKLLEHPVVQGRALMICQRMIRRNPKAGIYRDAEDLRQDLFISLWQNLSKFRCDYGEASFWKFFEIMARNIHLSQVRKSTREMEKSVDKSFDEFNVPSQEDQHLLLSIKSAFDSLSQRERLILEQRINGEVLVNIPKEAHLDIAKSTVYRDLENIQKKFIARVEGLKEAKTAKRGRKNGLKLS